jgi:hypothetical protein
MDDYFISKFVTDDPVAVNHFRNASGVNNKNFRVKNTFQDKITQL